jgi:hypothetical protein
VSLTPETPAKKSHRIATANRLIPCYEPKPLSIRQNHPLLAYNLNQCSEYAAWFLVPWVFLPEALFGPSPVRSAQSESSEPAKVGLYGGL